MAFASPDAVSCDRIKPLRCASADSVDTWRDAHLTAADSLDREIASWKEPRQVRILFNPGKTLALIFIKAGYNDIKFVILESPGLA